MVNEVAVFYTTIVVAVITLVLYSCTSGYLISKYRHHLDRPAKLTMLMYEVCFLIKVVNQASSVFIYNAATIKNL